MIKNKEKYNSVINNLIVALLARDFSNIIVRIKNISISMVRNLNTNNMYVTFYYENKKIKKLNKNGLYSFNLTNHEFFNAVEYLNLFLHLSLKKKEIIIYLQEALIRYI